MTLRACALGLFALGLLACGPERHVPPPQCTGNATCAATEVCFGGRCVDALSPPYHLALSIDVAPHEPDGTPWDSDGSPPDVEADLQLPDAGNTPDGAPLLHWNDLETFHASWEPQLVGFKAGQQPLSLHVVDADPFGSDFICEVQITDVRGFLHLGGVGVDGTSCRVNLAAVPLDPDAL